MRGTSVHGGRFRGVSFAGQAFGMLHLDSVSLEDCDLSNAEWERPLLESVRLKGCRLTGLRIRGGRATDLQVIESQGRYVQLEDAELKDARFEKSQLAESSFLRCALDRAVFSECDLRGTVLTGVRLNGADLRGCRVEGLRAGLDDLAGAILDPRQAAAVLYGQASIRVLELGEDPPEGG